MQTNNSFRHSLDQTPELMTFHAYNGLDRITLPLENIRCIQARENYMEFTWIDRGELQTTRLRNTLYVIENQLPEYFQKVHRSIIINLNHVSKVQRRQLGKGYEVSVSDYPYILPVSKTYLPSIAQQAPVSRARRVA